MGKSLEQLKEARKNAKLVKTDSETAQTKKAPIRYKNDPKALLTMRNHAPSMAMARPNKAETYPLDHFLFQNLPSRIAWNQRFLG